MFPRVINRGTVLNINDLYKDAHAGDKTSENKLFQLLCERFEQFAHQRIWDEESAKDVVQDALTVIAKEYRKIQFDKSFSAWAYKVLDNRILSYIKTRQRHESKLAAAADSKTPLEPSHTPDPELRLKLLDCLGKVNEVNPRHAKIIDMHSQGFSTEDICRELNLSRNSFYISLHRARKMLEICLKTGEIE